MTTEKPTIVKTMLMTIALMGLFAALVQVLGSALDNKLDKVDAQNEATGQNTSPSTELQLTNYRLQGTEPTLQEADGLQPQQATGGVGSY